MSFKLNKNSNNKQKNSNICLQDKLNNIDSSKQYKVEIQVIIQKIGQINTKNETFYAEFFVETSWFDRINFDIGTEFIYDSEKYFNPNIVLNNSIGEPLQEISYNSKIIETNKLNESKLVKIYERRKIKGNFWQKFDFKYFPMDVQQLNIEISTSNPFQLVKLIESKEKFNFLNPNAFMDTQEWNLYNYVSIKENLCKNDISSDQYSTFTICLIASRMPSYYFYNAFLLVFLITTIGLTRFTVSCDIPHVRLIIDTSVNLTLITFKWVIAEEIPQISYLTSLDKYTLFSIMFISSQSIYDSIIGVLASPKCIKPYGIYDLNAFIISGSILIFANLILLIWILFFAIRNRHHMYKKTKLSNKYNSKRLYEMYNKNLNQFDNTVYEKEDREENNEEINSNQDSDSIGSQTVQL